MCPSWESWKCLLGCCFCLKKVKWNMCHIRPWWLHAQFLVFLRRNPDGKDKVKALYIRIVSPFPEMERFLQDTTKRFLPAFYVMILTACLSDKVCFHLSHAISDSFLHFFKGITWSWSRWRAVFDRHWMRSKKGGRSWKLSWWGPGGATPIHTHSPPCVLLILAGQTTWESTRYS